MYPSIDTVSGPPSGDDRGVAKRRTSTSDRGAGIRGILLPSLLALLLAACSTAEGPVESAIRVDGSALAVFPSDELLVEDAATRTGLRVSIPDHAARQDPLFVAFPDLKAELESLDGFGTLAESWVRFTGPLDTTQFPARERSADDDSPLLLVDVQNGERIPFRWAWEGETHMLFVQPWRPLRPATQHAIVVRRGRDLLGRPLGASIPLPADIRAAARIPAGPVLAWRTFTTQSILSDDEAWLPAQAAQEGLAQSLPVTDAECSDRAHIAWSARGFLNAPQFRSDEERFPDGFEAAVFAAEARPEAIAYRFFVPKNAAGAPVVIVQHGLLGNKKHLSCSVADRYAARGFATIAIDAVLHGERARNGLTISPLEGLRMIFGVWTADGGWQMRLRFARDALRQTSLDHDALAAYVREVLVPAIDRTGPGGIPDGLPDLADAVYYTGSSMGGIIGSLTLATSARIAAGVLNVPGGRLSNFLYESELGFFNSLVPTLLTAGSRVPTADARRFVAIYQTIFERADPLNYAGHWWQNPVPRQGGHEQRAFPRSVLIQETLDDILVPNLTTRELARAGGLPLLLPALEADAGLPTAEVPAVGLAENLQPGVSGGLFQLKDLHIEGVPYRASHGSLNTDEVIEQAAAFFRGDFERGAARIIVPDGL